MFYLGFTWLISDHFGYKTVSKHFKKLDYEVQEEYKLTSGGVVNLVAKKGNKMTAIEIETGRSDPIYNIRKDLNGEFDRISCLTLDRNLKEKILSQLKTYNIESEKIEVESLSDFLEKGSSLISFKLNN